MSRKRQAAFAALNMIWQSAAKIRDIKLLVVDVDSQDEINKALPPTTKFPGGDEKPEDIGDPRVTANRELGEEVGLNWGHGIFPIRVHRISVSARHFRVGYAVRLEDCIGEVRTTPSQGSKGTVSPGYWMTVGDLREQKKLHQNHNQALDDFVRWVEGNLELPY